MHRRHATATQGLPGLTAPPLSHLQYFALAQISAGGVKAKALRKALGLEDVSQDLPTFHAFMGRLKGQGLVTGKHVAATDGARGRETAYSLTAAGRRAL